MDQVKIGKFISNLRKEKHMTQQELADKLNVTDRAVSNWENGRRLPDISLFKPLCEILGVSVNEMINGEKISDEQVLVVADNTIINALNYNDKIKKSRVVLLIILIFVVGLVMLFTFIYFKTVYPKIDIYNISVSTSDPDKEYVLKKQFTYETRDIFYYGVDSVQVCDVKGACYGLSNALYYNQISLDSLMKHLESQLSLGNVDKYVMWDGGTAIYNHSGYSVIFCNTLENNKDIYIGPSDMIDKLDGEYCGKTKSSVKQFIRTYKIISSFISDDEEFSNVTLEQNDGKRGTVTINNSNNIVVGRYYEFSFTTFEYFDETIENIFEYSTIINISETDKEPSDQVNEPIYVNDMPGDDSSFNDVKNVIITIKPGSLTRTSATVSISDFSGNKYTYGSWFRIDKFQNEKWETLELINNNAAFDLMAYHVDKSGKLELYQDWSYMYGELKSGKYRLVKYALPIVNRPVTESDRLFFSVSFTIE